VILEVAPCFDEVTEYSLEWSRRLHEELGEERTSCLREEAVRESFEDYVREYDPELITFYGHGVEDALVGNDQRPLMDNRNVGLARGREVYTMCCLAAKRLGADAYRKGCRAWWGYTEAFIFVTTDEEVFGRLANLGLLLRRKQGLSWEECVRRVKKAYRKEIDARRDGGNPWTVIALVHDRDALVCWSSGNEPPSECAFRQLAITLLGSAGQKISRSFAISFALFFASWGVAIHDFAHQVWELKGTILSPEGGYLGFIGMIAAILFLTREHIKWLQRYH